MLYYLPGTCTYTLYVIQVLDRVYAYKSFLYIPSISIYILVLSLYVNMDYALLSAVLYPIKNKMNCELMLTYGTPALWQTGNRNLTGQKTLPTIWGTYMKLVTKYQISAINSC